MAIATQAKQNTGGQVLDESTPVITRIPEVLAEDVEVKRLEASLAELKQRAAAAEAITRDEAQPISDQVKARMELSAVNEVASGVEASLKEAGARALDRRADQLTREALALQGLYAELRQVVEPDYQTFQPMIQSGGPDHTTTDEQVQAMTTAFSRWLPTAARMARIQYRLRTLESGMHLCRREAAEYRNTKTFISI